MKLRTTRIEGEPATPTLRDVAMLAGVSAATVSHVINDTRNVSPATRALVQQAAAQLGYVPNLEARNLALAKKPRHLAASEQANISVPAAQNLAAQTAHFDRPLPANAYSPTTPARSPRQLLRMLRAVAPISRIELARRLGLDRSTVTDVFKPLIASGIVIETAEPVRTNGSRGVGRPPLNLTFNCDQDVFVGVNLGIRGTQVGITDLGGDILAEEELETPDDPKRSLELIRASIARVRETVPDHTLRVIAVAVPGPTDTDRTRLIYAPHLGWNDVEIAQALKFKPNAANGGGSELVPVIVENDSTAAAMYEARLRLNDTTAEAPNNFILVRSGTGIGVGLVLGGEVYRGSDKGEGLAGEFGHMTIVAGGKPCACGNRGCWERYASASSAASLYLGDRRQLGGTVAPRFVEIVARAEAGEIRAQRTLERMGEYLGIGIGNVIMGLGVPRVIISGRIVYGWKFFQQPLHDAVAQSMAGKLSGWSVEPGEPRGAGLGGALEVAVDEFLTANLAWRVSTAAR